MPKLTASYKLNEEQLKQLKQIVPEAFKDNILDFNSLYEALSDFVEEDENSDLEQFGLSWPGKRQAKRAAAIPPVGTLVPVPGDGVDEETTKNIYIEGDNLEVLKILKKAYTGRVKMIYIDPPYNTGDDFIYPDDFSESVESYLRRTGQIDESGSKMNANLKSDGRFHSKWCSMIYSRLRLAREMLKDDGVIFISIDDNEFSNLLKITHEVFGKDNTDVMVWRKSGVGRDGKMKNTITFRKDHEYNIVAYKNLNILNKSFEKPVWENDYGNADNDPRGNYKSGSISRKEEASNPHSQNYYTVISPNGRKFTRQFDISKNEFNALNADNRIYWGKDGNSVPSIKIFTDERREVSTSSLIDYKTMTTTLGTKELNDVLRIDNIGEEIRPKPSALITKFLQIGSDKNSIILDFFSGSSTTAHAVMQLNTEDNGNRQFIMVQYQEPCKEDTEAFKAGYKNICEIGKERIRRAGKKIKAEAGLNAANLDTGFKVYRLAPSNYKAWENYNGTDVKQLEELFKADSLMQGWKEDDLLTEIMLLKGFPLDSKIELLPQFKKNKIKKISSDFHENTLYICLDKDIVKETIETLNLTDKERFICLDSAIDDQSKIRLEDKNLIKTL